jgi:hypothetical protein
VVKKRLQFAFFLSPYCAAEANPSAVRISLNHYSLFPLRLIELLQPSS